jgi:hypothetical protein
MVQGISSPGTPVFTTPAKPQQNQPLSTPGTAPAAPLAQATGGGRPVRGAPPADAEKRVPDERATERSADAATQLSIGLDQKAKRYVYKGIDGKTQEVQKQWPSEEQLKRIAKLRELTGQIVDELL